MTLSIFIGYVSMLVYFGALGYAAWHVGSRTFTPYLQVLRRLSGAVRAEKVAFFVATLLIATGLVAAVSTWFYVIKFFVWTFNTQAGGNWHDWVANSDLFIQAYRLVSETPEQWFWSSQLLLFTCGYVSILKSAFGREALWWALLGFLGAISVSLAFFVAYLICQTQLPVDEEEEDDDENPWVNPLLRVESLSMGVIPIVTIALAVASIVLVPWLDVNSVAYAANLLALHLLLVVALLPTPSTLADRTIALWTWLKILAGAIFLCVTDEVARMIVSNPSKNALDLLQRMLRAVTLNECQTSITLDLGFVFVASLLTGVWLMTREPLDEMR
jgi:alpha-1,2-mannosyltransferase